MFLELVLPPPISGGKINGTTVSGTGPTLPLSPLRLSDAGHYTCDVIVDSKSVMYSNDQDVTIRGNYTVNIQ